MTTEEIIKLAHDPTERHRPRRRKGCIRQETYTKGHYANGDRRMGTRYVGEIMVFGERLRFRSTNRANVEQWVADMLRRLRGDDTAEDDTEPHNYVIPEGAPKPKPTPTISTHPVELLRDVMMEGNHYTLKELAKHCGIRTYELQDLMRRKEGLSPWLLGVLTRATGKPAEWWSLWMRYYIPDSTAAALRKARSRTSIL